MLVDGEVKLGFGRFGHVRTSRSLFWTKAEIPIESIKRVSRAGWGQVRPSRRTNYPSVPSRRSSTTVFL